MIVFSCSSGKQESSTRKVHIVHKKGTYTLYRNGVPFVVKGGSGYTHMARLKAIGGNTVRTFDTTRLQAVLDEAATHGLAVIAGLYIPESRYMDYFYRYPGKVEAQYIALREIVRKYRSHPALLMWCLGNEVDFPGRPSYQQFYNAYNGLLDMIHHEDPDHPVTTTVINFQVRNIFNIRRKVRGLDIISFNTFGGIKKLNRQLKIYSWLWSGPFLVTEWGIFSPQEAKRTAWDVPIEGTSTWKAAQYRELYTEYLPVNSSRFLGSLTFYWGQKEETTPTWYSLFDSNGASTGMVGEMQALWTGKAPLHRAPELDHLSLNGQGAASSIITEQDKPMTAALTMKDTVMDNLQFTWEVLEEDLIPEGAVRPASYPVNMTIERKNVIMFKAPKKEGPYRIYVSVHDLYGNISTANIPFYVIETPSGNKDNRRTAFGH